MLSGHPRVRTMKSVYKLVLFDLDETLIKGRTIHVVGEKKGFLASVLKLESCQMISYKKNIEIAKLLTNMSSTELLDIFRSIPLQDYVQQVMTALKKKEVCTAIVTNTYQFLADDLKNRLGMDYAVGNTLRIKNGVITGELIVNNTRLQEMFDGCKIHPICKRSVVDEFCQKLKIKPSEVIAVGDGKIDICMLENAGLGVAFNASKAVQEHADISTSDLRIILQYV